jgi:phage repressor protein C with HTH and peptisase S24 domain
VKLIPVYGTAVAGRDGRFDLNGEIIERIPAPPGLGEISGAYAVYVVGDSMEPRYEAGETVFVHPRKPVKRRDYVIIQVIHDGDEGRIDGYIKRLLSISDDTVLCEQLNPPKQIKFPREKVLAIHKIVLGGEG